MCLVSTHPAHSTEPRHARRRAVPRAAAAARQAPPGWRLGSDMDAISANRRPPPAIRRRHCPAPREHERRPCSARCLNDSGTTAGEGGGGEGRRHPADYGPACSDCVRYTASSAAATGATATTGGATTSAIQQHSHQRLPQAALSVPPVRALPSPRDGRRTLQQLAACAGGLPNPVELRAQATTQPSLANTITSHGASDFAFPTVPGSAGFGWRQQKAALERARSTVRLLRWTAGSPRCIAPSSGSSRALSAALAPTSLQRRACGPRHTRHPTPRHHRAARRRSPSSRRRQSTAPCLGGTSARWSVAPAPCSAASPREAARRLSIWCSASRPLTRGTMPSS